MPFVLISFPIPDPSFSEAVCQLCGSTVYEQAENLARVAKEDGYLICVYCALNLKAKLPDRFPAVDAQLWEGHVRKPELVPEMKPILDFLNEKPQQ